MSDTLGSLHPLGAAIGLALAIGMWLLAIAIRRAKRPSLADRVSPYVANTPAPVSDGTPIVWRQLTIPFVSSVAKAIHRCFGGSDAIRRRLEFSGSARTVEEFRAEQAMWGIAGTLGGACVVLILVVAGRPVDLIAAVALVIVCGVAGVLARDWWLSVRIRQRNEAILAEFSTVAELFALSVTAGEAPLQSLERISRSCKGELAREFGLVIEEVRLGANLTTALRGLTQRIDIAIMARFVDGIVVALERGTPIGNVLRAQADDVRESSKRALLETAGKREIAMMVPVVFLVLPVTVLFALYPGLLAITVLTR